MPLAGWRIRDCHGAAILPPHSRPGAAPPATRARIHVLPPDHFRQRRKFYGLLEASAAAARESARALGELLATPPAQRSLEKFKLARQREKDLAAQISQELVNTFVTALEREDIEALSNVDLRG